MVELFDDQSSVIDAIRDAMREVRSVLLQAPCAFGKTVVLTEIVRLALEKGKTIIFCVHRKELIYQTAATFEKFELRYSFIAAGRPCWPRSRLFIASIPTLRNRLGQFPADFLIVDEGHLSMADGWQRTIAHYRQSGAYILSCSASPIRLDGRGLGNNFERMVKGPSVRELIGNGRLSSYRLFVPHQPDLSQLHKLGGDYRIDEAEALMDKPSITGDACSTWMQHAKGKRTVIYCVSRQHSKDVASAFRERGIQAVHIDGETAEEIRVMALRDLANGSLQVVTNCQLLTEGVDLSALAGKDVTIDCVVNLRPTQSLALWTQICGRALRRKAEPAVILDHAGVALTLGLPDQDIDWQLTVDQPVKKSKTAQSVRVCPKCFAASSARAMTCSNCGEPFAVAPRSMIEEKEGELVEITPEMIARKEARHEQGMAQSLEQLREIARQRGYAFGWAERVHKAREAKRAQR